MAAKNTAKKDDNDIFVGLLLLKKLEVPFIKAFLGMCFVAQS